MEVFYIELIGSVAGACTTLCAIPQIIKLWRTHSARDLSVWTYYIMCFGVMLWVAYGLLLHAKALIVANVVAFIFYGSILCMKLYWDK